MKKLLSLILAASALVLGGCATGGAPMISPQQGAAALRITVATGASLALAKNPAYIPAAEALVVGIDAVANTNATLTPEVIGRFVADICAKNHLPPEDAPVFAGLAQSVYTAYVTAFRAQVVRTTDPNVQLYIGAFKDGLGDALGMIRATAPPSASSSATVTPPAR